ncbi:MAG: GGDEF domain-containing protein [Chitinispirillaceae bacterium]|jgi:diguanylate cyclase (GGDEF)-like protein
MEFLLDGLIIIGALVLLASLVPAHQLIIRLPAGRIQRCWQMLRVLIIIFIAAYLSYVIVTVSSFSGSERGLAHFIVPFVFFLGACFVYLVNNFALETAIYIRRVADLELESIIDPLTGVYNRRYLDLMLKHEVKRSSRYNLPLSVIMLDIDHFKKVNDSYGHQAGDFVLASIGKLLLSAARTTDIVTRYGGEELMIIATNTPVSTAPVFAERLRKAVADSIMAPPGESTRGEMVRVTVSIGVASFGPETNTVETLVKNVDDALREAKAKGRNTVIVRNPHPVAA